MAESHAEPMTDGELAAHFKTLQDHRICSLMLAVSGGTDSLALLHLYARHRRLTGRQEHVLCVTVDHRLRPESAREAAFVAAEAARLDIRHETLIWEGQKPSTGLQQAAREARYRLMAARLAREPGVPRAILSAHTADDQAETFLMRLARGSGPDGLSSIPTVRRLEVASDILLIRPLLGISRARLAATLSAAGITPAEDPGNTDEAYERVRTRAALAHLNQLGVTTAALARSAARLGRAREALDAASGDLEHRIATIVPGVSTSFDAQTFWPASAEFRVRLLKRALERHGGIHPPARLSEIEDALERLERDQLNEQSAATLGGCVVARTAKTISIFRELGRNGLEEVTLEPGTGAIWDGRFLASLSAHAPARVTVRSIPPEIWALAKESIPGAALPARIALTLPSFWSRGELVALPGFSTLLAPGGQRHTDCVALPCADVSGSLCRVEADHCSLDSCLPCSSGEEQD